MDLPEEVAQNLSHVRIPITIADPSQPDCPLIYINEPFETLTGYKAHQVVGHNCRFLQGKATNARDIARIKHAVNSAQSISVYLRNYRIDGTEFDNFLILSPIKSGGCNLVLGCQCQLSRYLTADDFINQMKEVDTVSTSLIDLIALADDAIRDL